MRHATKERFARWAPYAREAMHARQVRCYANALLLSGLIPRVPCCPCCWRPFGHGCQCPESYGGTYGGTSVDD